MAADLLTEAAVRLDSAACDAHELFAWGTLDPSAATSPGPTTKRSGNGAAWPTAPPGAGCGPCPPTRPWAGPTRWPWSSRRANRSAGSRSARAGSRTTGCCSPGRYGWTTRR
ncbi:hypothetical protein GXW82_09285 [Streptacidiphilus sp. 4-A2]|nr:hypothetical protein [Streptacidiphilus sp. 4-A2]